MMTSPVAGIDPHQDTLTVGVLDSNGVELARDVFPTTSAGYFVIDMLTTHGVILVGIEGSASWGAHAAIALVGAGFDGREVPAQRSAMQRRSRRLDKTDAVDAVAAARALLAEPSHGPVQTLKVHDPLVAQIEAVLEHRRMLVDVRTLVLHHVHDQITKLPVEIRDQLTTNGKIERRLRRLEQTDVSASSPAGAARVPSHSSRRGRRAQIPSPARLRQQPTHQQRVVRAQRRPARELDDASTYIDRKLGEGKTRREARRAHKRQLASRVIRRMWKDESGRQEQPITTAA